MTHHEAVLDPVAHDARSRLAGLLFWFALPILAGIALAGSVNTFVDRFSAQPVGTKGNYAAQLRSCQGNVCQIAGTFTSDDGRSVVRSVLGDYRWKVGEVHRVVLNPNAEIIALPARWNPVATVVGGVAAAVFLGIWAWFVMAAIRQRLRP